MTILRSRTAASLAALAALAMTASPAFARGYGGWHHRHHHDGIDGGDLLAGLLIGGAVVAIASAASKSSKDAVREEPARYPYDPADEQGYTEVPPMSGYNDQDYAATPRIGSSFDSAVDACSSEIERGDRRIGSVDNVRRMGERFSVEGHLEDGRGYACSVDDNGQIRSVALDGRAMI
ncbi:hypothetical protein [Novosphingobium album (ex Hu et al. 2023)]|uniref:Secreted protein n=1 Tax=Novosphingobium album (ex Hu et al. 2023) TaxID=2930093 RepID=A0ABT0B5M4_9SPHN|nr:hypothetical protein [Novosphingobium album (ex Hu et al. 2023)]MCJ2180367.1 hypothetical protein [Novosphingobium album (ex Hu et al. 2023)]